MFACGLCWLGNQLSLAPRLGRLKASALVSQSQRVLSPELGGSSGLSELSGLSGLSELGGLSGPSEFGDSDSLFSNSATQEDSAL